MSVDRTIEELSGTLAQLGILVEHINHQVIGITTRINLTLNNFDSSVSGIATDAGLMTGQINDTVSHFPNPWVFYLLFFAIIVVLVLLSILILINLIARIHSIVSIFQRDHSGNGTPLPTMVYSESKEPLNVSYPGTLQSANQLRHIAVPMESEPRRFGYAGSSYTQIQPVPEQVGRRRQVFQQSEIDMSPRLQNYSVSGSSNATSQPQQSVVTSSGSHQTAPGPFLSQRTAAV
ncbi:hypothetical protein DdX_16675 [Ditylenchus destructor]|uniref:Uncharacterized protein n=1 Tax=Ditylenchus destructor TaxID=166010 RepID=A0AAD4MMZ6_9BILA|nr:hypothetical protein DdX_16675 [Ditylenchus destructor]